VTKQPKNPPATMSAAKLATMLAQSAGANNLRTEIAIDEPSNEGGAPTSISSMSKRIVKALGSNSTTSTGRVTEVVEPRSRTSLVLKRDFKRRADGLALSKSSGPPTEIKATSDLGYLVRKAREKRGLTQQEFADLTGVGRRFISELENGKPTIEFGKALKVALGAGISILGRQR
jgi:y4mF family transcriptional regulator